MKVVHGRINRRTYFAGSAISVFVTLLLVFFFLAPFALMELAFSSLQDNSFFNLIQYAFLVIPVTFFLLSTFSLTSKRAQDFGINGTLYFISLVGVFGVNHFLRLKLLSLAILLLVGILCFRPGATKRNKYGGKPGRKLYLQNIARL